MSKQRRFAIDLTPLKQLPEYRLLWFGGVVSATGSRLTAVAVPYQVFRITHSSLAVGLLGLCAAVPMLVLSIVGGAIADRVPRKRIMVLSALGGMLLSGCLALNAALDRPRLWPLYVLSSLIAASSALGAPARRSTVPLLVPREQIPAAAALDSASYGIAWAIGPALAGVLIAGSIKWAFIGDVLSFALSLVLTLMLRPLPRPAANPDHTTFHTIVEGLHFLRGRRVLQGSFIADIIAMVFGMPSALFPAITRLRYHDNPRVFGVLSSAAFAGAAIASLTSGWTGRIHRHGLATCVSVAVWGGAIAAFGFVRPLPIAVFLLAIAGGADMVSGVFRQSILQMATPPSMQGRMQGVGMAVWATGPPVGDAEAGAVARLAGTEASVIIGGVGCIAAIALLAARSPELLRYDSRTAVSATDADIAGTAPETGSAAAAPAPA